MSKQTVLFGLMAGLLMVGNAEAAYRCEGINAQGQREVVFSDLAIPDYECTSLQDTPPPAEDPEAAMQQLRDQVEALDGDQDTDTVASNQQDERDQAFAENCQIARDNLAVLESTQDVVSTDASGNKVLLDDNQRQQQLQQARKDMEYYCNP